MFRLVLIAFLFLGIGDAKAVEVPPNRLVSDAIPAWRKLKAAEEHVSFSIQERQWGTENGRPLDHWSKRSRKKFVRDGSSFLQMTSSEAVAGETYIGANPRYLFRVTRNSESAPVLLRALDLDASATARAELTKKLTILYSIARSRLFASIPLDQLITDPGFRLKRIEAVSFDGRECLKVSFAGALARHKQTFLDSWMILDPARNWSIQKSEASFARFTLNVENEYWPESGGISWLRHCKMTNTHPTEQIEENHEYLFDNVEQAPVPASTFLLTSFGMPEPDRPIVANYRSTTHYWFIGAAVALLVSALAVRWAARRGG